MDVVYIGKCTVNLEITISIPSLCGSAMPSFLSDEIELIEDTLMMYV